LIELIEFFEKENKKNNIKTSQILRLLWFCVSFALLWKPKYLYLYYLFFKLNF